MKNIDGFNQNLFAKYIELKKNYLILKNQLEEKINLSNIIKQNYVKNFKQQVNVHMVINVDLLMEQKN